MARCERHSIGAEGYKAMFIGGLVISVINYYIAGMLVIPKTGGRNADTEG